MTRRPHFTATILAMAAFFVVFAVASAQTANFDTTIVAPPAVQVTDPTVAGTILTGGVALKAQTNAPVSRLVFVFAPPATTSANLSTTPPAPFVTADASVIPNTQNTQFVLYWDSTALANGSYSLIARLPGDGVTTKNIDSVAVAVSVSNAPPISISIGSPKAGAILSAPQVNFTATTTATVKGITFTVTKTALTAVTAAPAPTDILATFNSTANVWAATWTAPDSGSYSVVAKTPAGVTSPAVAFSVSLPTATPNVITMTSPTADAKFTVADVNLSASVTSAVKILTFQLQRVIDSSSSPQALPDVTATPGATTNSWTAAWTAPATGTYTVRARSGDGTLSDVLSFSVDVPTTTSQNVVSVTSPGASAKFTAADVNLSAAVTSAVQGLVFQLQRVSTSTTAPQSLPDVTATPGATTNSWTAAWTAPGSGSYTIRARAADGTVSDAVAFTVELPTTVLNTITMITPAAGTKLTAAAVNFSASTTVAVKIITFQLQRVTDSTTAAQTLPDVSASPGATTNFWAAAWTAPGSGTYTVRAKAGDGTVSDVVTFTVELPTTTQNAVSVTSPGASAKFTAADVNLSAAVTSPVGALTFLLQRAGTSTTPVQNLPEVAAVPGATTNSWTAAWTAPGSGTYTVRAKAGDGTLSEIVTFTVELPTATPKTINVTAPGAGVKFTAADIGLAATSSVAVKVLTFQLQRVTDSTTSLQTLPDVTGVPDAANTSWTAAWTAPGSGTYTVRAKAGDGTLSEAVSFTVELPTTTAKNVITVTAPAGGAKLTTATVNLSATTSLAVKSLVFQLRKAATTALSTNTDLVTATKTATSTTTSTTTTATDALLEVTGVPDAANTSWTAAWTAPGSGTYTVAAKDGAGTLSTAVTFTVELSTAVGSLTVTSPKDGESVAGTTVSLSALADPPVQVLNFNIIQKSPLTSTATTAPTVVPGKLGPDNVWVASWTGAPGAYSVRARSGDGTVSPVVGFTLSSATPSNLTVTAKRPLAGDKLFGAVALEAVTSLSPDKVTVQIQQKTATGTLTQNLPDIPLTATNGERTSWSGTWSSPMPGDYGLTFRAVTADGGVASDSISVTVIDSTVPPTPSTFETGFVSPADGAVISGTVKLQGKVSLPADAAGFMVSGVTAPGAVTLLGQPDATAKFWAIDFNSTTVADGSYKIVFRAKQGSASKDSVIAVKIQNGVETGTETPTVTPSTKPPESTAPPANPPTAIAITAPAAGTVSGYITVFAATKGGTANQVQFSFWPVGTPELSIIKYGKPLDGGLWAVPWDTSLSKDGVYVIQAATKSAAGTMLTDQRKVEVANHTTKPSTTETSIPIMPKDVVRDAVQEIPAGTQVMAVPAETPSAAPEQPAAGTTPAAPPTDSQCVANKIPPEKCKDWLSLHSQADQCRQAGIVTREECLSYLDQKYGQGQLPPECSGLSKDQCDALLKRKTSGMGSVQDLQTLQTALFGQIGNTFDLSAGPPPGQDQTHPETSGGTAEQPSTASTGEPATTDVIADSVPLRPNQDTRMLLYGSPAYAQVSEDVSVRQVPAVVMVDSDGDGLPDDLEKRIGTDPFKDDTDGDGFTDWTEIKNGYNPLGAGRLPSSIAELLSPVDRAIISGVPLEQPRANGTVSTDLRVDAVDTPSTGDKPPTTVLTGRALPGATVTIYVYSYLPVVLTTTADDNGNWNYQLDGSLDDGAHEAYVAVNDDSGKISNKSNPISFIINNAKAESPDAFFAETATAVPVEAAPEATVPAESATVESVPAATPSPAASAPAQAAIQASAQMTTASLFNWYAFGAVIVVILGIVASLILFLRWNKKRNEDNGGS